MAKRVFFLVPAVASLMLIAMAGGYSVNKGEDKPQGCESCHVKLSEKLPEEHPLVTVVRGYAPTPHVKYCLECHGAEGSAVSFEWIIHLKHYSSQEFQGDCWSCHQIDEKGKYRLDGVDKEGIEVVKEDVDRMTPYYELWATSEYEDHLHAQLSVTCRGCHGSFFPKEAASMEQCKRCHGDGYTSSDADGGWLSHHWAPGRTCSDCHRAHRASAPNCYECHYF